MNKLFKREGRLFTIIESSLPKEANKNEIKLALYAAVHEEFKGAVEKTTYKNLNSTQKMDKLNEFAEDWLKKRGLL